MTVDLKQVKAEPYVAVGDIAKKIVSEGIVMLKNNDVFPLKKGKKVALFGRIQFDYYRGGTGSGGKVNTDTPKCFAKCLKENIQLDEEIYKMYNKWITENPFDKGNGWATEPWCQKEMPVSENIIKKASLRSETAIVIIGRTAGEDKDNVGERGSYYLTDEEEALIKKVSRSFKKTAVLLNTGNIIDTSWNEKYNIDGVMYIWQGGQCGVEATVDVLTGKVNPSGKLPDTIARDIADYYSDKNFGAKDKVFYEEDIYVGYRYFETFAKGKVLYPFGYGLSYTTFSVNCTGVVKTENEIKINIEVTNTGQVCGKEVVQVYYGASQGKLGKPEKELGVFKKTKLLSPGEKENIELVLDIISMASYDDGGVTGNKSCFVLEKGEYKIYMGTDVREAKEVFSFKISKTTVVKRLREALAPIEKFNRIRPKFSEGNCTVV